VTYYRANLYVPVSVAGQPTSRPYRSAVARAPRQPHDWPDSRWTPSIVSSCLSATAS